MMVGAVIVILTIIVEYLVYSLVDAVVDSAFPILTKYGEILEDSELELVEQPDNPKKVESVRKINRELLFVRRMLRPMKEVVEKMLNPLEQKWLATPEYDEQEHEGEEDESRKRFHFSASIRTYPV
jgi:Mg2+ and Co2+ transporter CorA